jgi:hypothetical protein
MMIIKVSDIIIEINPLYQTFLNTQIKQFETNNTPYYHLFSSLVNHIDIPLIKPISASSNIVNYETDQGFISLGYVDGCLCYQVKINKELNRFHLEILEENNQRKDELEFVVYNRIFSSIAIKHQLLTIHASAIFYQEEALLFAGRSGVGKTTLAKKWIQHQKSSFFINDDKPLILSHQDTIYVFGSPFSGQESLCSNVKAKIKVIIFIEQSDHHELVVLSDLEKVVLMMEHSHRFISSENAVLTTGLINDIIRLIPIYLYKVKDDEEAYHYLYRMLYT